MGACVHAFIGRLADGSIAAYQTLPWTMRGWHCGGTGNDTHISFEICEDKLADKGYFRATYQAAVELTAYLCRRFNLNPLADGVVLCHSEGYRRGIASNHADVMHWWKKFGVDMDDFRAAVAAKLRGGEHDLTEQQVRAIVREELAAAQAARDKLPVSGWAAENLERAKAAGITDGARPQGWCTRQEAALMILSQRETK